MVHVAGTRATSCLQRVELVSSVLLDFAVEMNIPVVPICFSGGLPVNPCAARLEFPFESGQQDIRVGSAITPATLRGLSLAQRSRCVADAINALAPDDEQPLPPNPRFATAGPNVLLESLRLASHRGQQSEALLRCIDGDPVPCIPWIDEFAGFLKSART